MSVCCKLSVATMTSLALMELWQHHASTVGFKTHSMTNTLLQHFSAFHFHVSGTAIITHFNYVSIVTEVVNMRWVLIWTGIKCCSLCFTEVSLLINWDFPLHRAICHTIDKMFVGKQTHTSLKTEGYLLSSHDEMEMHKSLYCG